MKTIKFLIVAAMAAVATSAAAQDFSDPKYAKWGETPEERKDNMLASSYLKEETANRNFNSAARYLQLLLEKCPSASETIYVNGVKLYKDKINRAESLAEKKMFVDSLLFLYDVRIENFANHPKRGRVYLLERKAREYLTYKGDDREGVAEAFETAIAAQAQVGAVSPEVVAIYFKNLCDDYQNDIVDAMTIVNAYEANAKHFANIDESQVEFKNQFEACFGASGAASCDNLQKIFEPKLAANPNDEAVLANAFALMSKANCTSDFFLSVAERYYVIKPESSVAMMLAQVFQNKNDYAKANQYLREALAKETVIDEREKLLIRIGLLEMTSQNYAEAVKSFNEALNADDTDDDGLALFFLAQCYVAGAKGCGSSLARQATYWVAYDYITKAIPLLEVTDASLAAQAKSLAGSYRAAFPSAEECFFAELNNGAGYTVGCGLAKGISTRVRYR